MLELQGDSSPLTGMFFAYFGCFALISSKDMSSAGCIILLAAPVVAIVFTFEPSLLLLPPGVFVVGGALIVAPEKQNELKDESETNWYTNNLRFQFLMINQCNTYLM